MRGSRWEKRHVQTRHVTHVMTVVISERYGQVGQRTDSPHARRRQRLK